MNDVALLTQVVHDNPDEESPAAMLIDELMTAYSIDRDEAGRQVERIREAGRDSQEMALAAGLIAPDADYRAEILSVAFESLGLGGGQMFVMLVPGGAYPYLRSRLGARGTRGPRVQRSVLVPARWVINVWKLHTDGGRRKWHHSYNQ